MSRSNLGTSSSGKASSSSARSESEACLGHELNQNSIDIDLKEKGIEKKENLNFNNTGRRGVLACFGIVVEYLRWCH